MSRFSRPITRNTASRFRALNGDVRGNGDVHIRMFLMQLQPFSCQVYKFQFCKILQVFYNSFIQFNAIEISVIKSDSLKPERIRTNVVKSVV